MQGQGAGTNSSGFKLLELQIIAEEKGFWMPADDGVYEEPHTQKKARATQRCIFKGKAFPEEAVSRKLRRCCDRSTEGLPGWRGTGESLEQEFGTRGVQTGMK